jgi:Family of unknown function (DUF6627)
MEGFMLSSSYFKTISQILVIAMLHLCWLTSYGYAEMVPTESAVQPQVDRQRLLDLLNRQEVVEELGKYGITKVEAVARINSLTDEEVTEIAGKLDELPEGGYLGFLVPLIFAAMAVGYVFFWLPALLIFCPFSDDSYGECISYYSGRWWEAFGGSSGGGGNSGGVQYYRSYDNPNAFKDLDKQVCRFDCGEAEKVCFGSISEDDDANTGKLQCEKDKEMCFYQCEMQQE